MQIGWSCFEMTELELDHTIVNDISRSSSVYKRGYQLPGFDFSIITITLIQSRNNSFQTNNQNEVLGYHPLSQRSCLRG